MWQERFKMFELKQIMRQREVKDFAELLNRLREGNHTKQDIQKLKQRIISITNHEYPKDAPHVFIQNAKVNDFNARAHNALPGIKYSIKAHDSVIGADSQQLRDKILSQIPNDPRKTKQLHSVLQLAVGERTEISLNTRTDDGMTNGAGNVIKLIQVQQTGTPSGVIWVQKLTILMLVKKQGKIIDNCTLMVFNQHGHQLNQLQHNLLLGEQDLFRS